MVGKSREQVEVRETEESLLALLAVGDVAQDRAEAHAVALAPDR